MNADKKIYEVIILGGGISGLTCSRYLNNTPHLLLEKNERWGGSIISKSLHDGILECGPNFLLLRKAEAKKIIDELGLTSELLSPSRDSRKRSVLLESGLIVLTPFHLFLHLLRKSPITNWKFIIGGASWKRSTINESVYDFFARKFSPYFAKNFARPMVSGIYGGDAKRILMKLAFPLFSKFDEKFNSFWLGAFSHFLKKENHPTPSGLYSFKDGLGRLIDCLIQKTKGDLKLGEQVLSLQFEDGVWNVTTQKQTYSSRHLVSSLPAYEMSNLLAPLDKEISEKLKLIDYPWLSVFFMAYNKDQIKKNPSGFGFLNAEIEKKNLLGCFYSSSMFASRFPKNETVFTIFVGGSLRQDLKRMSHEQHVFSLHQELKKLFEIEGDPLWTHQNSWEKSIPQYESPVVDFREQLINKQLFKGTLHFATNYVAGVSVPDCMIHAKGIAKNITDGGLHDGQKV